MEASEQENKGVWPHNGVLTDNTDLGGHHCLLQQMDNYNELQETVTISTRKNNVLLGLSRTLAVLLEASCRIQIAS